MAYEGNITAYRLPGWAILTGLGIGFLAGWPFFRWIYHHSPPPPPPPPRPRRAIWDRWLRGFDDSDWMRGVLLDFN